MRRAPPLTLKTGAVGVVLSASPAVFLAGFQRARKSSDLSAYRRVVLNHKKCQRKARQPRTLRPRAAQPCTRLEAAVGLEFSGLRCRREEFVSVSRGVSGAGARPGHRRKHSNGAGPCSVASLSCRKYTQSSAPTTPTSAGETSCCRAGL